MSLVDEAFYAGIDEIKNIPKFLYNGVKIDRLSSFSPLYEIEPFLYKYLDPEVANAICRHVLIIDKEKELLKLKEEYKIKAFLEREDLGF